MQRNLARMGQRRDRGGVMNEIDEFYKKLPEGRCKACKYARCITCNGGYMFLGCTHKPYRGKNISEIKDCPKDEKPIEECEKCKAYFRNIDW